jgi:hypothetical protein
VGAKDLMCVNFNSGRCRNRERFTASGCHHGSVGLAARLMKSSSSSPPGLRRKTAASAARRPFFNVALRRHWRGNAASPADTRMYLWVPFI